jgi:hypothetical protein
MNAFVKRVQNAVHRRRVHGWNNQETLELAGKVAAEAKSSDNARPVVMFNASTRLEGMSLNAAFQLLTGWSLRLAGAPVVQFACQGGMKQCVLGTNRDKLDSHRHASAARRSRVSSILVLMSTGSIIRKIAFWLTG